MYVDPFLIGGVAVILALVLTVYMPVSKRRVNQTVIAIVIAVLIFVAAFAFFEIPLALPIAVVASLVVIVGRFILGNVRSAIYHNFTRYLRRDYWQRKVGQNIIGSGRRKRRDDN